MATSGGTGKGGSGKEVNYKINIDTSKANSSLNKFKSDLKKTFDAKGIKPNLDKLNKEVNSTLNKMNSNAKKANDKFNKSFNTKGASKSISQISKSMEKEINKISNMTAKSQAAGNKIGTTMLKGMQRALSNVSSIGKVMVNQLSGLAGSFTKIGNLFGMSLTSGIKVAVGIMTSIGKMLANALAAGLRAGYALIRGAISGVTSIISTGLRGALNVVSKITSSMGSMIKDAINQKGRIDLSVDFGASTSKAYDSLSGNKIMGELNTMLSAMKVTLPAQIGSIFGSVAIKVADFGSKLTQTALLISQFKVALGSNIGQIKSVISSISRFIMPKLKAIFDVMKAYVKLQANTVFAPVTTAFKNLISQVRQTGQSLIDMAKNFVNSMGGISGIVNKTMSAFSEGISILKTGFSEFKRVLSSVIEVLKPWGRALSTTFKDLITVTKPLIAPLSTLGQLFLKLVETVGLLIEKLVNFGHSLVSPVKKFVSAVAEGTNKMLKGCNDFVKGVNKTLKGSPKANRSGANKNKNTTDSNENELKEAENVTTKIAKDNHDIEKSMDNQSKKIKKNTEALKDQSKNIKDISDRLSLTSDEPDNNDNNRRKGNKKYKATGDFDKFSKATGLEAEFAKIEDKAKKAADKIKESLNSINTDVPEEEIKDLEKELENAKAKLREAFNIKEGSNIKGTIKGLMDQIGKYSMWLAKIKNPLLTVRTEKAKQSLKELTQSAAKTKQSLSKAFTSQKMEDGTVKYVINYREALKSVIPVMRTIGKYNAFSSATKSVKNTEKDIQAFKAKVQKIFSSMFGKLQGTARSGWNKITGIFRKGAKDAAGSVSALNGALSSLKSALMPFLGLYAIMNFFKGCIDLGSDLAEVQNVVEVTFGSMTDQVDKWASNAIEQYGLSELAAKKMIGTYGAMAKSFGFTTEQAYNMSTQLAGLTGDVASFYNLSTDEAYNKLKAVFTGETEALKELGVVMTQSALDQYALANGFGKTTAKMTEQEKVALRYSFVMHQLSAANGDFARTSDSWANQVRVLKLRFESLRATIGQGLINVLLPVIKLLNILLAKLQVVANAFSKFTAALFGKAQKGSGKSTEALGAAANTMSNASDSLSSSAGTTSNALKGISNSSNKASKSVKKTANDVKDSAKKMKGALAGIDEINILSFDKPDDSALDDYSDPGVGDVGDVGVGDVGNFDLGGLDEMEEKVEEVDENMKKMFNEFFEPIKAAWDKMSPRLLKSVDAFKKQFKATMNQLGEYMRNVWKLGGKELLQHLTEIALALATIAVEISTRVLKSLEKLWKYLDPTTNMNTKAMLDKLNEVAELTRDFILTISGHFDNLMTYGGDEVLQAFGDTFHKTITACADVFGTFIKTLDGLLNHLDPITNELTRSMLQVWVGAINTVGDAFLAFADLIGSLRENGGQELINTIGEIAMALLSLAGTITDEVGQTFISLFEHLDPSTNPATQKLLDSLTELSGKIRDFVLEVGDAIGTFMDNGGRAFVNNLGDIAVHLLTIASLMTGAVIGAVTKFFDSWAGHVVLTVVARTLQALSFILELFLKIIEPISPVLGIVAGAFVAFLGALKVAKYVSDTIANIKLLVGVIKMIPGVTTVVIPLLTKFASGIAGIGKAVMGFVAANPLVAAIVAVVAVLVLLYAKCEWFRDGVKKAFENVKEVFSGLFDKIKEIASGLCDVFTGAIEGDWSKVGEGVLKLVTNAFKLTTDIVTLPFKLGVALIDGLIEGITGVSIVDKVKGLFESFLKWVKGFFGVHSPSTVFKGIGRDVIQGLINGITGMFSSLGNTAKKLVDTIVNKFSDIGKRLREKMNNAKKAVKDVIDKMKGLFKFKWSLPKLKLPHIQITGKWGFNPPSIPKFSVKWYRNGGLIDKPTNLGPVAGAGEAGKEVIVPLENSTFANTFAQVVGDKLSQAISVQLSNKETKNSQNNDGPRDIILKLNEREFARTTINSLNRYQKEQGRTLLKV